MRVSDARDPRDPREIQKIVRTTRLHECFFIGHGFFFPAFTPKKGLAKSHF